MLRSLFTGITGVRTHQVMMDVTANNIANVNTSGFKTSQTQFVDTISQLVRDATAPQAPITDATSYGGTNPAQVGLGVKLAGVTTNFQQGSTQLTGRQTDLMINGDGFFMVNNGKETMYTRSGQFSFDKNNVLVAPNGGKVLGVPVDQTNLTSVPAAPKLADLKQIDLDVPAAASATAKLKAFEISEDGVVTSVYDNGERIAVARIEVATFNNPQGLTKVGGSMYRPSQNSGDALIVDPGVGSAGRLTAGTLEMSNVDLATEFTNMILAQRGLQANSRTITTSDEILQELVNLKR